MHGAAATLFTLLTGNLPDRMGRAAFLWPPQGEASISDDERSEWKGLHALIRRATEENVAERFVNFRTMAGALSHAQPHPAPDLKPVRPHEGVLAKLRRADMVLALLAHGALAAAKSIFYNTDNPDDPPDEDFMSPDENDLYQDMRANIHNYVRTETDPDFPAAPPAARCVLGRGALDKKETQRPDPTSSVGAVWVRTHIQPGCGRRPLLPCVGER